VSTTVRARPLTEVAPGVWTAVAETWTSLTTIVVAPDGGCLVVDPGISVAEVESLAISVRERGWHVVAGFSTHAHWDHLLWTSSLGDVPRWATARAAGLAARTHAEATVKAEEGAPGHDHDILGRLTALPQGAAEVPWDGPQVLVVDHDGHSGGHAALVLPAARVLLAGDMLSDLEIPLLDIDAADAVGDYRTGLDRIEAVVRRYDVRVVVPGHGHVGDRGELDGRLAADRAYLDGLDGGPGVAGRQRPTDPRLTLTSAPPQVRARY
jgi:glyoxylase-like metal-dependent hydrolase (beta-lactamase superfamily II)